jgi:hypothetical protein
VQRGIDAIDPEQTSRSFGLVGFDDCGRACVTMRIIGSGVRRLGGRTILRQAFGVDLHICEVGIAILKCQRANAARSICAFCRV